jgi:hypothetical protein
MSRFIRCSAVALPAFLMTAAIASLSVPAQAATTFSGVSATDLVMAPGHAAVVLSSGAVSTEPVS